MKATKATPPRWAGSGVRFAGFGHSFGRVRIENTGTEQVTTSAVEDRVIGAVGVRTRYRADDGETLLDLAAAAGTRALADAGIDPLEVDVVAMTNWTDRWCAPEWGIHLASAVGADNAYGFDLNAGCAGFVFGVHTAAAQLAAPTGYRTALVVSAERFTRRVRPGSKGELAVSDAAGAAVLRRGDPGGPDGSGLIDSVVHSTARYSDLSTVSPRTGWVKSKPELNEIAVDHVLRVVEELLDRNGLSADELDWVVPHSATEPFSVMFREKIGVGPERILTNLATRGNVSSASIPTTLSEHRAAGRLRPGDLVVSPSIAGGGWMYAGLLYRI